MKLLEHRLMVETETANNAIAAENELRMKIRELDRYFAEEQQRT